MYIMLMLQRYEIFSIHQWKFIDNCKLNNNDYNDQL